jgi:hypothetical protein
MVLTMAHPEKIGEQIWKDFHEALQDRVSKAFFILPEGYTLFRKAVESFDVGAIEGAVLLCRATIESAFLLFLSIQWHSETSFDIVFPTSELTFKELRDEVKKRVRFSEKELTAIDTIREDGNFVAHFASRMIKQRNSRVERFRKWESNRNNVTDADRIKGVNKLLRLEKSLVTRVDALQDLRDTASIMLTLGKAAGKHTPAKDI